MRRPALSIVALGSCGRRSRWRPAPGHHEQPSTNRPARRAQHEWPCTAEPGGRVATGSGAARPRRERANRMRPRPPHRMQRRQAAPPLDGRPRLFRPWGHHSEAHPDELRLNRVRNPAGSDPVDSADVATRCTGHALVPPGAQLAPGPCSCASGATLGEPYGGGDNFRQLEPELARFAGTHPAEVEGHRHRNHARSAFPSPRSFRDSSLRRCA